MAEPWTLQDLFEKWISCRAGLDLEFSTNFDQSGQDLFGDATRYAEALGLTFDPESCWPFGGRPKGE